MNGRDRIGIGASAQIRTAPSPLRAHLLEPSASIKMDMPEAKRRVVFVRSTAKNCPQIRNARSEAKRSEGLGLGATPAKICDAKNCLFRSEGSSAFHDLLCASIAFHGQIFGIFWNILEFSMVFSDIPWSSIAFHNFPCSKLLPQQVYPDQHKFYNNKKQRKIGKAIS